MQLLAKFTKKQIMTVECPECGYRDSGDIIHRNIVKLHKFFARSVLYSLLRCYINFISSQLPGFNQRGNHAQKVTRLRIYSFDSYGAYR